MKKIKIPESIYNGNAGRHFLKYGLLKLFGLIDKVPPYIEKTSNTSFDTYIGTITL